jgi:hypothetical protein
MLQKEQRELSRSTIFTPGSSFSFIGEKAATFRLTRLLNSSEIMIP